jgi:hypothetical protein
MFCSWRVGSASINVACDNETNAPDAGKNNTKEISRTGKLLLSAVSDSASVNTTPPPRIRKRRRHTSPRMPMTGSTRLPTTPGSPSSIPTWA